MRIAITGASGFVGQHVLRELLKRDVDIVVAARSPKHLAKQLNVANVVAIDIADCGEDSFERLGAPDALIHLAWGGLPNYRSTSHVESELPAQMRFLSSCVKAGLTRLAVAGTCFEYGLASGELSEDAQTRPCTQYGMAKDMLRKELQKWQQDHDFELAWQRLFYLYGEGQSNKSLYPLLREAIQRGDQFFDMSGGEQVRDFLPVTEAARLIAEVTLLQGNTGILNICSGTPMTVKQLVQNWIVESGANIKMNLGRVPYSNMEPMAFWGSREKLDALLEAS